MIDEAKRFLLQKAGPLPVWAWAAVGGTGILIYRRVTGQQQAAESGAAAAEGAYATDGAPAPAPAPTPVPGKPKPPKRKPPKRKPPKPPKRKPPKRKPPKPPKPKPKPRPKGPQIIRVPHSRHIRRWTPQPYQPRPPQPPQRPPLHARRRTTTVTRGAGPGGQIK